MTRGSEVSTTASHTALSRLLPTLTRLLDSSVDYPDSQLYIAEYPLAGSQEGFGIMSAFATPEEYGMARCAAGFHMGRHLGKLRVQSWVMSQPDPHDSNPYVRRYDAHLQSGQDEWLDSNLPTFKRFQRLLISKALSGTREYHDAGSDGSDSGNANVAHKVVNRCMSIISTVEPHSTLLHRIHAVSPSCFDVPHRSTSASSGPSRRCIRDMPSSSTSTTGPRRPSKVGRAGDVTTTDTWAGSAEYGLRCAVS